MGHVTVPGNSSSSLNSTRFTIPQAVPHYPQNNGFAEALVGILKKLMEKSIKDGKTVELWTTPVLSYTHFQHHSITTRSPHVALP